MSFSTKAALEDTRTLIVEGPAPRCRSTKIEIAGGLKFDDSSPGDCDGFSAPPRETFHGVRVATGELCHEHEPSDRRTREGSVARESAQNSHLSGAGKFYFRGCKPIVLFDHLARFIDDLRIVRDQAAKSREITPRKRNSVRLYDCGFISSRAYRRYGNGRARHEQGGDQNQTPQVTLPFPQSTWRSEANCSSQRQISATSGPWNRSRKRTSGARSLKGEPPR